MTRRIIATYRLLAKDCLDMAERANPFDRERLVSTAEVWLNFAVDELDEASKETSARADESKEIHVAP
jgi:hypothetical protein